MVTVPKALPVKFRRDVVEVARRGEASISRIARDFGTLKSCRQHWPKIAFVEYGVEPGVTQAANDLHSDDPGFGYQFIADEIEAAAGLSASERRVWRPCSEQRLWS